MGDGPSEFMSAGSVATCPDGSVVVADSYNGRIQRFRADGAYLGEMQSVGQVGGLAWLKTASERAPLTWRDGSHHSRPKLGCAASCALPPALHGTLFCLIQACSCNAHAPAPLVQQLPKPPCGCSQSLSPMLCLSCCRAV